MRWISPDKPGYGGSDYHRGRSLLTWGDDLDALAGRLGLERFGLAGESGGGPFALGAAHRLSGRVSVVALIASGGPQRPSRADRASQQRRIRFYGSLARNAPALNAVPFAVQEVAMTKRPWPFSLSEIKTPVHLWHGARDSHAPISNSRHMASELPDATLHISETSGHDIGHDRCEEITAVIASYVT